jgi:signal transduction histidine kinase
MIKGFELMRKPRTVGSAELSELYFSLKNTLDSPAFVGDAYVPLVEEIQLTLDAPLIVLHYDDRNISNALKEEYEFIRNRRKMIMLHEEKLDNSDAALIKNCTIGKWSMEALTYTETDRKNIPLRSRFMDIRGILTLAFECEQKPYLPDRIDCYLEKSQFEHLDKDQPFYLKTQEFVQCVNRCLAEIYIYFNKFLSARQEALRIKMPTIQEYDLEFFTDILSDTKKVVERLLPQVHKGFEEVARNRMLLQFFIMDRNIPSKQTLRYLPTEDQIQRFRETALEAVNTLKIEKLDSYLGKHGDPLSLVMQYPWDVLRSFTAYCCNTGCLVYSSDWLNEPLIKGDHLTDQEQNERRIVSNIMQIAQKPSEQSKPILLTVPWFLGREIFGALQINATEELSVDSIRKAARIVRDIFNLSELELRHSEILGSINAVNQVRASLIMLGHDAPKFLSGPIVNSINYIQGLIEEQLENPSKITKEYVIEQISNRMAQLTTLATHYKVFLHTLIGTARFYETGELTIEEAFTIDECIETVRKVFEVLHKQTTFIVDKSLIPYLDEIKLETNICELESATIQGAKSLLIEIILNLLNNSINAITRYSEDSSRNPLRLNTERGKIKLVISSESTEGENFLKVVVEDQGVGIAQNDLDNILTKINEVEAHPPNSFHYMKMDTFVDGIATERGRKGYGFSIILEVLRLLSTQYSFRHPQISSGISGGTKIEIWFPVKSIRH